MKINNSKAMSKEEREDYIDWMKRYFGESDTQNILQQENVGQNNPEAFWCSAMAIRYINLLGGLSEVDELKHINHFLSQVVIQIAKDKEKK